MDILNNKQKTIISIVVIFMVLFIGYYIIKKTEGLEQTNLETEEFNDLDIIENEGVNNKEEKIIKVHITGAVENQGIVEINSDSRIYDVIEEAGRSNRRSGFVKN